MAFGNSRIAILTHLLHPSRRSPTVNWCVCVGGVEEGEGPAALPRCVVLEAKRWRLAAGLSRKDDLLAGSGTGGITKSQNSVSHCVTVELFSFFFLRGLKPADVCQSLFCVCKRGLDIKRAEAARLNAGEAIIRLNLEYTSRPSVW